jgi:hypothetical protein
MNFFSARNEQLDLELIGRNVGTVEKENKSKLLTEGSLARLQVSFEHDAKSKKCNKRKKETTEAEQSHL